MNTDNIITLFCDVDDFCLKFEPEFNKKLIEDGIKKRNRKSTLYLSEVMTITICFHYVTTYTQEKGSAKGSAVVSPSLIQLR
jgi:hypothetical protein